MEIHPTPRELHSRRRSLRAVQLVPVRTVRARINPQPIAVPVAPPPREPIAIGAEQPCSLAIPDDNSPAARARRARCKLRRLFEKADEGQKVRRVSVEIRSISCCVAPTQWSGPGSARELGRKLNELRAEAQVPISRMSSLFLVLLRSALPRLDGKRASKMALALATAADQDVTAKRLAAFLWHNGGIEGAARQRASAVRRASSR